MTKAILSPRGPTRTACGPRRKPNARARGEAAGESRAGPGTARGFGELWPRWHRGVCLESGANGALPWCQLQEPSLYIIKAVFILDNDGHRLLAKVTSHPRRKAPEDTVPQPQEPKSPPS
uniref:Uncharacterized protein n=1 Tax=Ursus americanus TaxID=9643 RepID=A0A452RR42_URSAM